MSITVDLVCDILSPSGYSAHARELVKALHPVVDLKIVESKHDRMSVQVSEDELRLYKDLARKTRAPQVRIQFETPEFFKPQEGVFNIGFTQWETTRIPDTDLKGEPRLNWVKQMNKMNAMWTSCHMAKKAFVDSGVTVPVDVVQGPIDTDFYRPRLPELDIRDIVIDREGNVIPREKRVPVVAMIAQWTMRKNIEAFLITMLSMFNAGEVIVLLKTYGSSMEDPDQVAMVRERVGALVKLVGNPTPPQVSLITHKMTDAEIAALYSSIDIYVNTSRGEGFCMPLTQAMASECFPISCAFSAPADYIRGRLREGYIDCERGRNSPNGLSVGYTLAPAVGMSYTPWYRHTQMWGDIDRKGLGDAVRWAIDLRAQKRGSYDSICRAARETVVSEMSTPQVGLRVLEILRKYFEPSPA
jgi:glycosyltransferase involved in cell wall biosynthesis